MLDHYKRLEQRVEAADVLIARLCSVLMQSKGKLLKSLLDAGSKDKNAEHFIDHALELAFEHKGLASLSSSQMLRPEDKVNTAYQEKFPAKPNETLD